MRDKKMGTLVTAIFQMVLFVVALMVGPSKFMHITFLTLLGIGLLANLVQLATD